MAEDVKAHAGRVFFDSLGEKETETMFAKLTKWAALKGADRVLDAHGRIDAAIDAEVAKLQTAVRERLESERGLRDSEAAAALGETADPAAARRRLEQALKSIERQAGIL